MTKPKVLFVTTTLVKGLKYAIKVYLFVSLCACQVIIIIPTTITRAVRASVRASVPSPQTAPSFILRRNLRGLIGGDVGQNTGGFIWGTGLEGGELGWAGD